LKTWKEVPLSLLEELSELLQKKAPPVATNAPITGSLDSLNYQIGRRSIVDEVLAEIQNRRRERSPVDIATGSIGAD
jgi:hypothetical protein